MPGCCRGGCASCASHHWVPPSHHWVPPSHCSGSLRWEECSNGHIPAGAVHGGRDTSAGEMYVGRAHHSGDLLPAKVVPSHRCAYVSYAGKEHSKTTYEVLVSDHVAWKPSSNGQIPPDAICVGKTSSCENLYAGRAIIKGSLTPGKVQPSHGCAYVPYGGGEHSFKNYEILILV